MPKKPPCRHVYSDGYKRRMLPYGDILMPLKGAIIGFGNIAINGHLPGYSTNSDTVITAVMDVMPQAAEKCREILPQASFYNQIDRLFAEEDIDFVDIATPPGTHAANILKALEHGRHVLCEKPLVLKGSEYKKIASLSSEKGCVVHTVHNWRHAPIFKETDRLLASGAVGKVKKIEYTVIRTRPSIAAGETGVDDNWRIDPEMAGGGILVDHGWHAFYMINQWTGENPLWVECSLENRKYTDIPLEDTAEVLVGYDNAESRLFFTWAGDARSNRVMIQGESGSILVDDDVIRVETPQASRDIQFPEALSQGSHHPEWYGEVIQNFVSEIMDIERAGRNFLEAGWCQTMMETCALSSSEGVRKTLVPPMGDTA